MSIDPTTLPALAALVRVQPDGGAPRLALWTGDELLDLSTAGEPALRSFDMLAELSLSELRAAIAGLDVERLQPLDVQAAQLLAPVESAEVWAAGVTYRRSREARMEEAVAADIYARVYEAERPELFLKATGWRVVAPGGEVGIRSDSGWDVPEPELAVLSNRHGEVIAYTCGNDMSSRSIEGENPLYLPQAKVYDASCALGPAAVLAWHVPDGPLPIRLEIERDGERIFEGETGTDALVRRPEELIAVLHSAYTLPHGAWLMTGTGIVPAAEFTLQAGDEITISLGALGTLRNTVRLISHSGASAPPRIA